MAEIPAVEVENLAVRFQQRDRTIHAVNGVSFRKLTPLTAWIVRSRCWKRTARFSTSTAGISAMAEPHRSGVTVTGAGDHHVTGDLMAAGNLVERRRCLSTNLLGKDAA